MGRSRPAPLLRSSAGARLTVTRRAGKARPAAAMAPRMRDTLSRTAASGSPTTSTRGSCEEIRTSTSIGMPRTPASAALQIQATSAPADGAPAAVGFGEADGESEVEEAIFAPAGTEYSRALQPAESVQALKAGETEPSG